jgi:hypothetical protein
MMSVTCCLEQNLKHKPTLEALRKSIQDLRAEEKKEYTAASDFLFCRMHINLLFIAGGIDLHLCFQNKNKFWR